MAFDEMDYLEEEEDTQYGKYLTFSIGEEAFGLEIQQVREIISVQPITELPEMPHFMKGVINLRGTVFPVIDMRLRFRKPQKDYDERTCIIVVEIGGITVGLIVDCVLEVLQLAEENISPPPDARTGIVSRYFKGIGKSGGDMILLIDEQELFHVEEMGEISAAATAS